MKKNVLLGLLVLFSTHCTFTRRDTIMDVHPHYEGVGLVAKEHIDSGYKSLYECYFPTDSCIKIEEGLKNQVIESARYTKDGHILITTPEYFSFPIPIPPIFLAFRKTNRVYIVAPGTSHAREVINIPKPVPPKK